MRQGYMERILRSCRPLPRRVFRGLSPHARLILYNPPLETRFPFSPASCLAMSSKEQDFRSF